MPVDSAERLSWLELVFLEQARLLHFASLPQLLHFSPKLRLLFAAAKRSTAALILSIDVDFADSGSIDETVC